MRLRLVLDAAYKKEANGLNTADLFICYLFVLFLANANLLFVFPCGWPIFVQIYTKMMHK